MPRLKQLIICSIEGCQNIVKSRGLCVNHYQRQRLHGDPNFIAPSRAVPASAHPIIRQLFDLLNKSHLPNKTVEYQAKIAGRITNWRRMSPKLKDLDAVLNVIGYHLEIKEND